jgi:murein DD-endopeptidase MepM/ murein hydrolase activator NlpD
MHKILEIEGNKSDYTSTNTEVELGQVIGEVGNSGFTLEPHLHFQMMDENTSLDNLLKAKTIPFHINRYERWNGNSWEEMLNGTPEKGERIRVVNSERTLR